MTFSILPAEKADLTVLVEIFHEAFATDPMFSIIFGKCDRKEVIEADVVGYEKEFDTPGRRFFKLVDSESGYVGHLCFPAAYSALLFSFCLFRASPFRSLFLRANVLYVPVEDCVRGKMENR